MRLDPPMTTPSPAAIREMPWRVGSHYGIHLYAGDTPLGTMLTRELAQQVVAEHNKPFNHLGDGPKGAGAPAYLEVTPEMIDAGVRVLTTEFGAPTENPLANFPAVARETFLVMLAASFAGSSHSESK